MNSGVEWKSEYELGVEDIDFQHHFFLDLINRLAGELKGSCGPDYQTALISELIAYARFHFISEENLMFRSGYPEFIKHKNLHFELLDQHSSQTNMLAIYNSEKVAAEVIDFLIGWFFGHTSTVDRVFADYLHREQLI